MVADHDNTAGDEVIGNGTLHEKINGSVAAMSLNFVRCKQV